MTDCLFCFVFVLIFDSLSVIVQVQEPITRSMQLPHIPVTAFSQTDLFLVQTRIQTLAGTSVTNHKHGLNFMYLVFYMSTCAREVAIVLLYSCRPELNYIAGKEA